jgi:Tol biopolymer transport system component
VQVLCDVKSNAAGEGTWGPGGVILFSNAPGAQDTRTNEGILRVPENGGTQTVVLAPSKDKKESLLRAPYFLPDGRHFVYLAQEPNVIYVASLDSSEPPKRLLATESRAAVAPEGYLLFVQQGNLMAQTFDLKTLVLSGNAFPVAESVRANVGNGRSAYSVSNNGTLVYRTGAVRGGEGLQATWFDREGKPAAIPGQSGDNRYPRLSPDGKQIVVERRPTGDTNCTNCNDLWTIDLQRGTNTRLTFGKGDARVGGWSADGARIVYASNPEGAFALFTKLATGVGNEELLLKSDLNITAINDVSRDYLLFTVNNPDTGNDIWVLPLTGTRTPKPFVNTPFNQGQAHFSDDGRWIAYVSNESGQNQIYIQPFPATGQRILVSVDGGTQPRWRGDGKELFFSGARRLLMSVEIKASASTVDAGKPVRLFLLPDLADNSYDVTQDGQRFLIASPPGVVAVGANAADNTPLTVVTNWTAAVKPVGIK